MGYSSEAVPSISATENNADDISAENRLVAEQILFGADGDIHYSYYLPENFDNSRAYSMMIVMPGYDMIWFGDDSSCSNLNWSGFPAWTELLSGENILFED